MEAAASESALVIVSLLATGLQIFPLAVLIAFAPALLAAGFFFITSTGGRSDAFRDAALAFTFAFAAVAVTSGVGLYAIGWKPGPRSEIDVVRTILMQYSLHSVIFFLVGGWLVWQTWMRSRVTAGCLAALIVTGELWLVLSDPFATAALRPLVALCHVAAYFLLLVAVVWWTRRSGLTRQPT
jgi:hypothetical protein